MSEVRRLVRGILAGLLVLGVLHGTSARAAELFQLACLADSIAERSYTDPVVDEGYDGLYIPCTRTVDTCQFVIFMGPLPLEVVKVRAGRGKRALGMRWLCPGPLPLPRHWQYWPAAEPEPTR